MRTPVIVCALVVAAFFRAEFAEASLSNLTYSVPVQDVREAPDRSDDSKRIDVCSIRAIGTDGFPGIRQGTAAGKTGLSELLFAGTETIGTIFKMLYAIGAAAGSDVNGFPNEPGTPFYGQAGSLEEAFRPFTRAGGPPQARITEVLF